FAQRSRVALQHLVAADEVAALVVNHDHKRLGLLLDALSAGFRQLQLQRAAVIEGGGHNEEDDQREHHVDQRGEADLRFLEAARGADVHAAVLRRGRAGLASSMSISSMACSSISTTYSATRPRK